MYYRVAIRREGDQPPSWQWQSTVLSSLQSLLHFLRLYGALSQDQLRIFSSSSRESLQEQLTRENDEFISHSVTAAQFLQEKMIHSVKMRPRVPEQKGGNCQETASIAVCGKSWLNENGSAAHTLDEGNMSRLSRRRLELELGPGGDHDVTYSFALPASVPQVLAWMRLLTRVHRGELQP